MIHGYINKKGKKKLGLYRFGLGVIMGHTHGSFLVHEPNSIYISHNAIPLVDASLISSKKKINSIFYLFFKYRRKEEHVQVFPCKENIDAKI